MIRNKKHEPLFIDGKEIKSLDDINMEDVYKEMSTKELLRRRMDDTECGRQSRLIGKMIRWLSKHTDEFTCEELNLVDKVRVELADKFNKEWNETPQCLKTAKTKRIYIEWKKEQVG